MSGDSRELLLTWYGDDFSGSTDVMEALGRNGIPAVLFLKTPTDTDVARFPDVRAIGVAGISRSQSPEWMSEHLPPVFRRLRELRAPVCQYKVCSTFDSSPSIGSIGRALDIGQEVFGTPWVPLIVGAPILKRYTLFGNLFATVDGTTHRLDRHPTMSRHPVTPMEESDLRLHLAAQTQKRIGLVDILALASDRAEDRLRDIVASGAQVVLFDVLDEASLRQAGRLLWQHKPAPHTFAVASSGLEYALAAWWNASREVPVCTPSFSPQPADRIVVVSGSCSPVTEGQTKWAIANGFEDIPLDASQLAAGENGTLSEAVHRAEAALALGRSVIIYTALGPDGVKNLGDKVEGGGRIGSALGRLLREIIGRTGVRRAVVAGGDTSGHAAQQLDILAVTMMRPLAPGSPLCLAHRESSDEPAIEIVFKGGQVGTQSFFGLVRDGRS